MFIILTNILYKHFYNGISYSGYYKDDAEFYSTVLRQLDPNNSEQVEEYVEIKTIPKVLYTPNDPFINKMYALKIINAYQAWDISQGDTNIVIGF